MMQCFCALCHQSCVMRCLPYAEGLLRSQCSTRANEGHRRLSSCGMLAITHPAPDRGNVTHPDCCQNTTGYVKKLTCTNGAPSRSACGIFASQGSFGLHTPVR